MTREEAKDIAALLQAYAEGSTLQILRSGKWSDIRSIYIHEYLYAPSLLRVKPEPASVWAIRLGDNGYDPKLFTDKKAATEYMLDEYYDFYGTEVVRLFEQPESCLVLAEHAAPTIKDSLSVAPPIAPNCQPN